MNRNRSIAILVTAAILAFGWWILTGGAASLVGGKNTNRPAELTDKSGSSASKSKSGNAPTLAPQNVLSIRPNAPKPSAAIETAVKGASAAAPYKESELARAYRMRESAQTLLARIAQTPNDGEALRIKAEILERCAKIKGDKWREAMKGTEAEKMETRRKSDPRGAFLKSLPSEHPDNAARISSYDRLNPKFCEGLENFEVAKDELNVLYSQAEKAGDVPAMARALACDVSRVIPESDPQATFREELERNNPKVELTQEMQSRLQTLLAHGHPAAFSDLMAVMNFRYANVRLSLPNGMQQGTSWADRSMRAVESLLRCDFGAICAGPGNLELDRRCALQGQCNAQSVPDAIHFYELSPSSSQRAEAMRQVLRDAMTSGNFSAIRFAPAPEDPFYSTPGKLKAHCPS
jgi:hypothetical protein